MSKIKFGVTIGDAPETLFKSDYNLIIETALQCESLNFHSLWVMDHLTWGKNNEGAVFEAWTLLSALAAETRKIKLGPLVACNSFRNPSLTAKITSTLDVISDGRLILGYGAGWKEDEYKAYGFPFPKPIIRLNQMREGIDIIKKLWTQEKTSFKGDFYQIKDAFCDPKPIQKPHPPIMIGGGGERFTLRIAAELGDGWDIWGANPETYGRKVNLLNKYCDEFGRKMEEIQLSWSGNLILAENKRELKEKIGRYKAEKGIFCTYDECIEALQDYINLGCTQFIFSLGSFQKEKEHFSERIASSF
jgi:F420-dependent oxidoreductase-like protein